MRWLEILDSTCKFSCISEDGLKEDVGRKYVEGFDLPQTVVHWSDYVHVLMCRRFP
jgi:hypothetical protein